MHGGADGAERGTGDSTPSDPTTRRSLLRRGTLLVAGVLATTAGAGCLGSPGPPTVERVWIPDGGDANGDFAVRARVANPRETRPTVRVYLYATIGDRTLVRERDAPLPARGSATVHATYGMTYADAVATGSVGARADVRTD